MDIKYQLTAELLKLIDPATPSTGIEKLMWTVWRSPKKKDTGFALTDAGFDMFSDILELKFYQIDLPDTLSITNKVRIWLDKYVDCPFYISNRTLFVSREKVAVQLVLFSGDLHKFGLAKETSQKLSK